MADPVQTTFPPVVYTGEPFSPYFGPPAVPWLPPGPVSGAYDYGQGVIPPGTALPPDAPPGWTPPPGATPVAPPGVFFPPGPAAPPSTGGSQNLTPSLYDTASGWLGGFGIGGALYRTVKKPSRFAKDVERLASRVGLNAIRGALSGVREYLTPGPAVQSGGRAIVPYVEKGAGWIRAGFVKGIARATVLGPIIEAVFPEHTSTTDEFPLPLDVLAGMRGRVARMVFERDFIRARAEPSPAVRALLVRGPDVVLGSRSDTGLERIGRIARGIVNNVDDPELLLSVLQRGSRLTATAPGFNDYAPLPDVLVTARRVSGPTVGPRPTGTAASSPTAPTPAAKTLGSLGHGRLGPAVLAGLGLGIGALLLTTRRGGSASGGLTFAASPIAPGATIVTPPAIGVQPQSGFYAIATSGASGGYCVPAPRGPRRKCLERAPVSWRAGRNKGKAAGSKCVRYAQRKSA